jgi:hypothetical protein
MKKISLIFLSLIFVCLLFFYQFFLNGKLPIPSDTIIGLYHPYRDLYAKQNPNGIAYKNFLITDPVRQQFPWKQLVISQEKKSELPLWNPYIFSGTPLLGNFQSAAFYPLNILLFLFPFSVGWSILIILQPVLAASFIYLFLRNHNLSKLASFMGGFVFAFCGFSISWLEWNTVMQTALWLPLLLLVKDKLIKKISVVWILVFLFAECSAILAGHLQTYFYFFVVSNIYLFIRLVQASSVKYSGRMLFWMSIKRYVPFIILGVFVFLITAVQLIPTFQFINLSARDVDQSIWQQPGWFIPWQHLVGFIAPDFFGNPTTLNYWGIWNYGELTGYVGIVPFLFALFALFFRRDKKTLFFGGLLFLALFFSLPTALAKIPYQLSWPFISTAQPTRLLFVVDFCLATLSALGFDLFLRHNSGTLSLIKNNNKSSLSDSFQKIINKAIIFSLFVLFICLFGLWLFVFYGRQIIPSVSLEQLTIAKSNLYLPTLFVILTTLCIVVPMVYKRKESFYTYIPYIFVVLTVVDLFRFGLKFTPFTNKEYLFPSTKVISFLQKNTHDQRIMSLNPEILPPNFSVMYKLQTIEGYDPLYLRRYAEFITAIERNKPDVLPPFGFNRIITPHRFTSPLINLLGVKYILSLSDIQSDNLKKVFEEGKTRVYENTSVLPRAFFVENTEFVTTKQEAINGLFASDFNPKTDAIVEYENDSDVNNLPTSWKTGSATITSYEENNIVIKTASDEDGFLVLTDSFYPTWHVSIDGKETKIYRANYNFRGVVVPKGDHTVEFSLSIL